MLHADETGTRIGVRRAWVHTLSSNLATMLVVHPKRGVEALRDIGVLEKFNGVLVHEGGAPTRRSRTSSMPSAGRTSSVTSPRSAYASWCAEMTEILLSARAAAESASASGHGKVQARTAARIRLRYHATLDLGFSLLPVGRPPRRRHHGNWTTYQREAWNLASRLRSGTDDVLRLLEDTAVPLTNNAAERALRMVKLHDKIRGTFRSDEGARSFATIRSYLQTSALNGKNRLDVLRQLFTTGAWLRARERASVLVASKLDRLARSSTSPPSPQGHRPRAGTWSPSTSASTSRLQLASSWRTSWRGPRSGSGGSSVSASGTLLP